MIHAYSELYLAAVMKNLAAVMDIAINAEGLDADTFGNQFAESKVAKAIENAVPNVLTGKSATELLSDILQKDVEYTTVPLDRTSAYWAGWVLAKAQWELRKSFREILAVMPLSSLIAMYYPYHEADESKTVDVIRQRFGEQDCKLKQLRKKRRLTQEQLAALSGVNLRSIRSYEQQDNEIGKASGETLQALAQTLDCQMEDLLE